MFCPISMPDFKASKKPPLAAAQIPQASVPSKPPRRKWEHSSFPSMLTKEASSETEDSICDSLNESQAESESLDERMKNDQSPPWQDEHMKNDQSSPWQDEQMKSDQSPPWQDEWMKSDQSPPWQAYYEEAVTAFCGEEDEGDYSMEQDELAEESLEEPGEEDENFQVLYFSNDIDLLHSQILDVRERCQDPIVEESEDDSSSSPSQRSPPRTGNAGGRINHAKPKVDQLHAHTGSRQVASSNQGQKSRSDLGDSKSSKGAPAFVSKLTISALQNNMSLKDELKLDLTPIVGPESDADLDLKIIRNSKREDSSESEDTSAFDITQSEDMSALDITENSEYDDSHISTDAEASNTVDTQEVKPSISGNITSATTNIPSQSQVHRVEPAKVQPMKDAGNQQKPVKAEVKKTVSSLDIQISSQFDSASNKSTKTESGQDIKETEHRPKSPYFEETAHRPKSPYAEKQQFKRDVADIKQALMYKLETSISVRSPRKLKQLASLRQRKQSPSGRFVRSVSDLGFDYTDDNLEPSPLNERARRLSASSKFFSDLEQSGDKKEKSKSAESSPAQSNREETSQKSSWGVKHEEVSPRSPREAKREEATLKSPRRGNWEETSPRSPRGRRMLPKLPHESDQGVSKSHGKVSGGVMKVIETTYKEKTELQTVYVKEEQKRGDQSRETITLQSPTPKYVSVNTKESERYLTLADTVRPAASYGHMQLKDRSSDVDVLYAATFQSVDRLHQQEAVAFETEKITVEYRDNVVIGPDRLNQTCPPEFLDDSMDQDSLASQSLLDLSHQTDVGGMDSVVPDIIQGLTQHGHASPTVDTKYGSASPTVVDSKQRKRRVLPTEPKLGPLHINVKSFDDASLDGDSLSEAGSRSSGFTPGHTSFSPHDHLPQRLMGGDAPPTSLEESPGLSVRERRQRLAEYKKYSQESLNSSLGSEDLPMFVKNSTNDGTSFYVPLENFRSPPKAPSRSAAQRRIKKRYIPPRPKSTAFEKDSPELGNRTFPGPQMSGGTPTQHQKSNLRPKSSMF